MPTNVAAMATSSRRTGTLERPTEVGRTTGANPLPLHPQALVEVLVEAGQR